MAVRLLGYEVADLCLGKPSLRLLSSSATVGDALAAVNSSDYNVVSVWSCDHSGKNNQECVCIGKVCMVDIICYLCREENLSAPALALKAPVTVLLHKAEGLVRHVKYTASLLEAIDLILQGAHYLVIPIKTSKLRRNQMLSTNHNGREFCWVSQQDVLTFLLNSIGLFSPLPALPINSLGIITSDFLSVDCCSPALSAVGPISQAHANRTSVAVLDSRGALIGEISPATLASYGESAAAAVAALSVGELMAYADCWGPRDVLVAAVDARLREKGLEGMMMVVIGDLENGEMLSDDELASSPTSTVLVTARSGWRCGFSEVVICRRGSSLAAVMMQAVARRVGHVWVVEEDGGMIGIVTVASILRVMRGSLEFVI